MKMSIDFFEAETYLLDCLSRDTSQLQSHPCHDPRIQ